MSKSQVIANRGLRKRYLGRDGRDKSKRYSATLSNDALDSMNSRQRFCLDINYGMLVKDPNFVSALS